MARPGQLQNTIYNLQFSQNAAGLNKKIAKKLQKPRKNCIKRTKIVAKTQTNCRKRRRPGRSGWSWQKSGTKKRKNGRGDRIERRKRRKKL
jgi:hypothetical protein